MTTAAGARRAGTLTVRGRRAIWGAFLGFFVDMFDVYLPIVVLAPAIAYFVSPSLSDSTTGIVEGVIFATALIGRPIGAFIFGHFGDVTGRKRTAMPAEYTPLVFLVVSGFLILIGAAWGPETKDVDFSREPEVKAGATLPDGRVDVGEGV